MDLKKLIPWNWFKKEEEEASSLPVKRAKSYSDPLEQLHFGIDRWFNQMFSHMGLPWLMDGGVQERAGTARLLKPSTDVAASEKEYIIRIEVPGLEPGDLSPEVTNDTLVVRGEKKQEREEKDSDFYRIERTYGIFQRVLSLPEDVDQDRIETKLTNGVLTIRLPRKQTAKSARKIINEEFLEVPYIYFWLISKVSG